MSSNEFNPVNKNAATNYGTISDSTLSNRQIIGDNKDDEKKSENNQYNVLVTGASGYVASHLIVLLLNRGYKVIGTIRGNPKDEKYSWILNLNKTNNRNNLTLVNADLLTAGSFDKIVENCDYIMHVASPYVLSPADVQKELVEPAVNGTLNVLQSCLKCGKNVKKVIITSSMASITDEPVKKYTENDWNETSTPTRNAYYYSKVKAEKAAWKFMEENKPSWDLATINPWLVIGPELAPSGDPNTSNQTLLNIAIGVYPARLNFAWAFVDVRDVALSHIVVMENKNAKGRHIVATETLHLNKVAEIIDNVCDSNGLKSKTPSCHCDCSFCCCFIWCASFGEKKGIGDFMRTHINKIPDFDNSKIRSYGMTFRPIEQSIKDTLLWASDRGLIEKQKIKKKNFVFY